MTVCRVDVKNFDVEPYEEHTVLYYFCHLLILDFGICCNGIF